MKSYFTIDELTWSTTATMNNINNTPPSFIKENLQKLIEFLNPLREAWGSPIIITSGYRSQKLNDLLNGSSTSAHCFDPETEILTTSGWRTIDTISKDDICYSYNLQTKKIEKTPINQIIIQNYDGDFYKLETQHLSLAVTSKHRMLTQIPDSSNKTERIELIEAIYNKRRKYRCAAESSFSNKYNVDLLRLCMAVISDGCVDFASNGKFRGCRFKLVKKRDIDELEDILEKTKISYTKNYVKSYTLEDGSDYYCWKYYINATNAKPILDIIGKDKKIPFWFLDLSPEILKQLIITYAKFDGTFDLRKNCSGITIFSVDEQNIDLLQLMCVFSNMRCVKKVFENWKVCINNKTHILSKIFHLYITQTKNMSKVKSTDWKKIHYKGKVWCVNNNNTTVIIRRNGKASIQGNCVGWAVDMVPQNGELDKFKQFVRDYLKDKEFDQYIDEQSGNSSWVHLGLYHPDGKKQRKQFLLYRNGKYNKLD